jgi:glycosyltransferase involved in cell wall biosynthesis
MPSSLTRTDDAMTMSDSCVPQARLSILVPVYNGQDTIGRLVDVVVEELSEKANLWEIVLVNDGSPDDSHSAILESLDRHPDTIRYIQLYQNFGEHNAVMCGLNYVTGDCVAIIDDDFQNPPEEIVSLLTRLYSGDFDVVYSYYERKRHSLFRNLGSQFNNWMATILLGKPPWLYLSSFKIIKTDLVRIITQYRGPYPYIDGLILRSTKRIGTQLCEHREREVGSSSYTFRKLVRLWLNMSTGFSVTPLRIASILGLCFSALSLLLLVYFLVVRIYGPIFRTAELPPGWASIVSLITFFVGVQLLVLGVMGEYVGRLFLTVNGQPQYIIRDTYGVED